MLIVDDGKGFVIDDALFSGRNGLGNMIERAKRVKATLDIQSNPDSGTTVFVTMSLNHIKWVYAITDKVRKLFR